MAGVMREAHTALGPLYVHLFHAVRVMLFVTP